MKNFMPHFGQVTASWTWQGKGKLTAENLPDLDVAIPPEFDDRSLVWKPEQLYVGAINACFMASFLALTNFSKLDIVSFNSEARGKIEKVFGVGLQITELTLKAKVEVKNPQDIEEAKYILEKAKNGLVLNSAKATIKLETEIICA